MASLMYLEESYAWIFIEPPSQIKLDLMKIEYSFRHLSHMVILRSSNCQSPCPCAPQCLHTPVLLKKLSKLAPFIVSCMVVHLVLYCCPWRDNLFFSSNLGSTGFLILKSGTKSLRILLSVIIGHKLGQSQWRVSWGCFQGWHIIFIILVCGMKHPLSMHSFVIQFHRLVLTFNCCMVLWSLVPYKLCSQI